MSKNTGGSNLVDDKEIGFINYQIAALFEHVDVYLNNYIVSSTHNYGYKCYLESLLTYSNVAKKSWLQAGGYFKDTNRKMDTLSDENTGFKFIKPLIKTRNIVELIGKIHSELFNQERLLLSNVDLKLAFTRHNDNFCLMAAAVDAVKI